MTNTRGRMFDRLSVGVVVAMLAGGLVVAAVREDGFRSDHVTLHDNSVWVAKTDGEIGRFNYDLQLVDTKSLRFDPIRDLHQTESTVVIETTSSRVFSYNVAMNRADGEGNALPERSVVAIGGTNGALLDTQSSKVWFTDRTGIASIVPDGDKETEGSVELTGADDLVVGADGALHVLDTDGARLWRFDEPFARLQVIADADLVQANEEGIDADEVSVGRESPGPDGISPTISDGLTLPDELMTGIELDADLADGYQMTTAGDSAVLLVRDSLVLDDGSTFTLPADVAIDASLQQPSSRSDRVLISSQSGLHAVSLTDGAVTAVVEHAGASPIAPVSLFGCDYAAWGDAVFSSCSEPSLVEMPVSAAARFRTNRSRVVLNFIDGSLVAFPQSEQMISIDNTWADALDPNQQDDDNDVAESVEPDEEENTCEVPITNSPPIVPSRTAFTVRVGQSTTLDVLNPPGGVSPATDPDCDVLTVSVDPDFPLDPEIGVVAVVNNGRALQFQPSVDTTSEPILFGYLVSDGWPNGTVSATAQVTLIPTDDPGSPPIANRDQTTVEVGRTVVIDVLANDVDPDGDPLSLKSVTPENPGDGTLVWQPSGRVAYTAPGSGAGTRTIEYVVSDDRNLQATGILEINVISAGVKSPPNPRSDSMLAMFTEDGTTPPTFELNALANDSDPNGSPLRITEVIPYPDGPPARFDDDGNVSISPTEPGSYNYVYTVVDIQGEAAQARIRFEILPDMGRVAPVAVRDSVVVSSVRPTVVDVLRNDIDLNGDVLMVTSVNVPEVTSDDLNVEILDNQYIRVSTKRSQPRRESYSFTYTITDGEQESSATVTVGIIPSGATQPPVTLDDRAQVHLGGYLSIPVLLNDFDPNGIPLTLVSAELDERAGAQGAPGRVFVQQNEVRYVPPTQSERPGPFTATGTYTVTNGRDRANGRFTIEVTDPAQNRPPAPAPVELRMYEGQTITYTLPSYGMDPDGDPVELVGLDGTAARQGSVELAESGAAFTYTPFAGRTGTDSFRWQLRDSYDAVGYLDVRVVIGPRPAGNRPPVAVRDTAQVVIGQSVFIPVLANDTDPDPGDIISFAPDRAFDQPNIGAGEVTGATDDGFISYQAPDEEGEFSFLYYITDGQSPPVPGLVTVTVTTADKIVNRPPVVRDIVLGPAREGEVVTVDLAPYASDPEGAQLTFGVGDDGAELGATVEGSVLTVTMGRDPMIFTFFADDGADKDFSASGVIQIPSPRNRAPQAEVLEVEIAADEFTTRIVISPDLFSDPDGDEVSIYVESDPIIEPPEASNGGDMKWDENSFVFNRNPEFGGTARIAYFIIDEPSTGEAIVQPATIMLTIIREENAPPVITEISTDVISGTTSQFDLMSVVSDPDPADAGNLTISDVSWVGPSSVAVTNNGPIVTFTADIDAVGVGETVNAEVRFTVDDGRENGRVDGRLIVNIRATNLGEPIAVDDLQDPVQQGESPIWNLLGNDPPNGTGLGVEPDYEIVSTTQPDLGTVTIVSSDSVQFTPSPDVSGQTSFQYTIQDRAGRQATATVRFAVHDRPATPSQPTVGEQLSATAVVTFARPDDRGSPIDSFEVRIIGGSGGTVGCDASPCTIDSLQNGTEYTFEVRASNAVGWSDWSPASTPYIPDELPGTPPIPQADWNDQSATVTWSQIPNAGSEIIDVTVSITPPDVPPAVFSGGEAGGDVMFAGLSNGTPYTFTIVARNAKGDSPRSSASPAVTPAGAPSFDSAPTFFADNGFVSVSWPTAFGNGDDDLSYTVRLTDETSGSATTHNVGATLLTTLPAVNGHVYYAVINVSNKYTDRFAPGGVNSPQSVSDRAIGIPSAPATVTAAAGAGNGAINLSWSPADPAGGTISRYQVSTNGGAWVDVGLTTSTTFSSGLTLGANYSFQVRALNDNRQGVPGNASNTSNTASPYTPPANPTVNCTGGIDSVSCSWSVGALNGPAPQVVTVSGATSSSQPSGTWPSGNIGRSQTRTISVRVCNGGTSGNNCSSTISASASTWPQRTISIAWGGSAEGEITDVGGSCSANCRWVVLNVRHFAPGTYEATCQEFYPSSWTSWRTRNIGVDSNGSGTSQPCFMGFQDRQVRVIVDGAISNVITRSF